MATLKVLLHEARDLPVMDRSTGLADTYVVLRLDNLEFSSSTCTGTRFPVWNSDFRFDTADLLVLQEDPLEVRVYDHDILSRDSLVGCVNIDLNSFIYRDNPALTGWFPIFDDSTGLRGDIRLTLRIKFHAAENPLAPQVVERIIPRLPIACTVEHTELLRLMIQHGDMVSKQYPKALDDLNRSKLQSSAAVEASKPSQIDSITSHCTPSIEEEPVFSSDRLLSTSHSARKTQKRASEGLSSSVSSYFRDPSKVLEPISVQSVQQPSLTSEEEGVHIFSVSRLDPSVYWVESTHSMVEELLVKADPEHYSLSNLRSAKNINRARLVQFFKLSGKVRRQLAQKVIGIRCNAVLGYREEFNLEPYGIIVRAYGTPCVISTVKFVDVPLLELEELTRTKKAAETLSSKIEASVKEEKESKLQPNTLSSPVLNEGKGATVKEERSLKNFSLEELNTKSLCSETSEKLPKVIVEAPLNTSRNDLNTTSAPNRDEGNITQKTHSEVHEPVVPGGRESITILSLKELPPGCIKHIGGYICARSVKIISKNKSKAIISRERDAWWMELREELRANARAFHCNAILGYEEVSQYQDDVALLTLSGTAVMLSSSMINLRGGADLLFKNACSEIEHQDSCSLLHLYAGSHRRVVKENARYGQHSLCGVCRKRLVPDFLLASTYIPGDVKVIAPGRLVEVHVAKMKRDVKSNDLAKVASQELPFIEFALHKQLLFQLRLQQLNSAFGINVSIVLGPDTIVGTLTGTGCRIAGLPISPPLRTKIIDPLIVLLPPVMELKEVVRRSRRKRGKSDSSSSSSSSSSSQKGRRTSTSSSSSSSSSSSWISTDHSSKEIYQAPEQLRTGGGKIRDIIVKIDDEEEADMMLGMDRGDPFQNGIMITVPYVPASSNAYYFQNHLVLIRRYNLGKLSANVNQAEMCVNRVFNNCCADAKKAFTQLVCKIALRLPEVNQLQVVNFRIHMQFEQHSHDLHMRLEGALVGQSDKTREDLLELEEQAFHHCLKMVSLSSSLASTSWSAPAMQVLRWSENELGSSRPSTTRRGSIESNNEGPKRATSMSEIFRSSLSNPNGVHYMNLFQIFLRFTAPFSLPYVFFTDAPPLKQWFPQMSLNTGEQENSEGAERRTTYDSFRVRQMKGTKSLRHHVQSLISNVTTSVNRITGGSRTASSGNALLRTTVGDQKMGSGATVTGVTHCPLLRLPENILSLQENITMVHMSCLDYVPGYSIVRYLWRLSQHFIREEVNIQSPDDLGAFYQTTEKEVLAMIQSMVLLQGGNALLGYSVVYHEIEDSDGNGSASALITVTGDVVQVTQERAPNFQS